jgi:hypothetical protein
MVRRSCTLLLLVVVLISCRRATGTDEGIVFWTPSAPPTQTARVVRITTTPVYTYTPIVKVVTSTPIPAYLCVIADEAVYLRPSADNQNYPISPLPSGSRLTDLGGRKENEFGKWAFVAYQDEQGWVNLNFAENCK